MSANYTIPKIAFILQTHDASPHLSRLCPILKTFQHARVFSHHDFSKCRPHPALAEVAEFCEPHRKTAWARVSQALATMDVLEFAARRMPEAEWFILLSAACYPIKSAAHIEEFLAQTSEHGFLDINVARPGRDLPGWWWSKVFTRPFCRIPFISRHGKPYLRSIRIRRRSTPFNKQFRLLYGANWFILRRPTVERLLDNNPKEHPLVSFFDRVERAENKHMSLDECIVQTILGQEGSSKLNQDPLRFIDWENSKNWHPNILTMNHWEAIQRSNALFARKFDHMKSRELLDQIDAVIS